jgi:urea carboxylase
VTDCASLGPLLVANRGEIAVRVLATASALGMETVAVYSDADAAAPHVRLADRAVRLGPAPARESYLCREAVLQAALSTGAGAVHPGYGFLAEDPCFARAVEASGLVFVGPTPEQLELFGVKHTARAAAAAAGVPLVPGSGLLAGLEEALEEAERIGYPVMVKATGGGGGIGIAPCEGPDHLVDAFERVARLGDANFGNGGVFLERRITTARHVEAQVLGDGAGTVVVLGDRDCSLQRRNQKVVEEAPAPNLPPAVRDVVSRTSEQLCASVSYRSAGTVEFVYDVERAEAMFLEVNTRLQVEHPVTEAVTGRDLVVLQLQIADGRPLGFEQSDVKSAGHAVECRLNAEDVTKGFMPSPGTLSIFAVPELRGLRVDTHCFAGATIPPYYDSLMAKLIGHGDDRDRAIDVVLKALEGLDVEGVETNRALLTAVLGHPDFRAGAVTTDWLQTAIR